MSDSISAAELAAIMRLLLILILDTLAADKYRLAYDT